MIGLKRGTVELVDYNPEWQKLFEQEAILIKEVLGTHALSVDHVGSTSIPGISAKPIIDIGIIVPSLTQTKDFTPNLDAIGYTLKTGDNVQNRLFFTKGPEDNRTHYLHIGEKGSGYIEDMVLFRDYLLQNPNEAKRYNDLKEQLASTYSQDRALYTKEKGFFMSSILKKARK